MNESDIIVVLIMLWILTLINSSETTKIKRKMNEEKEGEKEWDYIKKNK